jgi:diguanylate cyclase (GGDEF)-like protein
MRLEQERVDGAPNLEIVREMNRELRSFLEHSLSSEAFWDKWTSIDFPAERQHCWEIKNCSRDDCPSYRIADSRCWLISGTLCCGDIQGDFAKKYRSCFSCEVLGRLEDDALRSLYEHINILIHHLRERDQKIVRSAITDPLTGVYNRLYFNEYMGKRLAHAGRYEEKLSLIMIDLDEFKGVNDTYGHLVGDQVLLETATLLRGVLRNSDLIFRYGGDEFLVVLAQTSCEKATLVKGRIRKAVEQWNRQNNCHEKFPLSLSMGCSTWTQGDDLLGRVGEADDQMYHEKHLKKLARPAAATP